MRYDCPMANAPRSKPATLADLMPLLEAGQRVELIDGELVERALPTFEHGAAQTKIGAVLDAFNRTGEGPRGPGGWWIVTEVEIAYGKTSEVFRHDASGFPRDNHASRPQGMPVRARPDWVCEILSTTTARYDVVKKKRTLHAHGVPHYWILDPERGLLTVYRWSEAAYLDVLAASAGDVVRAEPFDAVEISVSELFGRDD